MDTKYNFGDEGEQRIAYVRPVAVSDLPDEVREQLGEVEVLYAVHAADGTRLALVRDRNMAFVLARQNDMDPVTVH